MPTTPYDLAQRYIGIHELNGTPDHPLIVWWLSLCAGFPHAHDETPWCSAFVNGIAWELRLPRSKSAAARSWLLVGQPTESMYATPGYDVAILARGEGKQPGPEVIHAPGHVGFFAGFNANGVSVLAGNQNNAVSLMTFPQAQVLGIRRLSTVVVE